MFQSIISNAPNEQKKSHEIGIGENYYSPGLIGHIKDSFRLSRIYKIEKPTTITKDKNTIILDYSIMLECLMEDICFITYNKEISITSCSLYINGNLHSRLTESYIRKTQNIKNGIIKFQWRFNCDKSLSVLLRDERLSIVMHVKSVSNEYPSVVLYCKEYTESEMECISPIRPLNNIEISSFEIEDSISYSLSRYDNSGSIIFPFSGKLYGIILGRKDENVFTIDDTITISINDHLLLDKIPILALTEHSECLSYMFSDFFGYKSLPEDIYVTIPEQKITFSVNICTNNMNSLFIDFVSSQ